MIFADGFGFLLLLALWLFCLIDVITTPPEDCRNLPKPMWLIIVILLPDIGSIVWLVAGHDWSAQRRAGIGTRPGTKYGVAGQPTTGTNPDDDAEFQRLLRKRVEEQRKRAAQEPESGPTDGA
jgi:hypothetical protein